MSESWTIGVVKATSSARTRRRWRSRAISAWPRCTRQGRIGLLKPTIRLVRLAPMRAQHGSDVVLAQPGDNWMLHVVAEQIREGDLAGSSA